MAKSISPLLKNAVCSNKSMTRTFHPVGQGAFYSERFYCGANNVFNMVYDCGTHTNHSNLSKIISEAFPAINGKKQKIDYLFVSHFHEDHVNGIKMLLTHCEVQNMVIPAIKNKEILLCDYIHNGIRSNSWDNDGNKLMERVLSEPNARFLNYGNQRTNLVRFSFDIKQDSLQQATNVITIEKIGWEYIPFCSESGNWNSFIGKFVQDFPSVYNQFNGGNYIVLKDFFNKKPKEFDKLKKIYKDFYKNPKKNDNYYSMTILSKPTFSNEKADEKMCLYTGDYPARDKTCLQDLKAKYTAAWKAFKTMQIPHHGSRYDNPSDLYDVEERNCVFSYGTNNQFHHPNGKMLAELLIKKEFLFPVNEGKVYEKDFKY